MISGLIRLRAADGDDDVATVGELDVGPAQNPHLAAAQRPVKRVPTRFVSKYTVTAQAREPVWCRRGSRPRPWPRWPLNEGSSAAMVRVSVTHYAPAALLVRSPYDPSW